MKVFLTGMFCASVIFLMLFLMLHRVGRVPRHDASGPNALYREQLLKTESQAVNPPAGSEAEQRLVERVQRAFSPFSVENVVAYFPEAYAETFYFRDAFHVFTELEPMVAYMEATADASPGVTFEFEAPARNGIDFYLPWVMVLPGENGSVGQRSVGVSRLRFNEDGKVIFHQDYWDSADVLVKRVPVANGLIELVRRRF